MNKLFTIGHSTHTTEEFIKLLTRHGITAVCDVRSSPYSRYNPQFNRETLRDELKKQGIAYVFFGKELGPRSDNPSCFQYGKVRYDLIAATERFQKGLNRLREGVKAYRVTLLCSEKDPVMCHRMNLVCRHLRNDFKIRHILEDGHAEKNVDTEKRLMRLMKITPELFDSGPDDAILRAYAKQSEKIAYMPKKNTDGDTDIHA
ncbi:DUF488 domain-containing protein [Desulfococcaceae bacterium HSG9]|nr:DUF488 domain-containing protein [Desulfococcaceae bacterium HSG9]